ncbi:DASS family sodium-coupled anion symporter [Trinickia caryophylli]|uniref:Anion transporter n=1 Tax=Trinickia caryophylli TaxID=28094 RepID=A0A1X7FCC6_TRICW|nr:DASS family sodium-coupled anion symporter [Trinickia caryophylli]PMS10864.1 sodium:cation symporter [Trinickia caryophylli]TRX18807.1 DASS family sodium-coupled anion symporter [Trinickia caryophylli]WQE10394.1 DASS family sodium-coupled anion symporter [Trinickia caryophylli]SMF50065.1 anion transporter [Trinickia caryophylli]GLU34155.1 membrane protein [Trinickia caryophylli]
MAVSPDRLALGPAAAEQAAHGGARVRRDVGTRRAQLGFLAAWLAFGTVLLLLPAPQGLGARGHATLAVVVWAAIVWMTEAVPVGVSGLGIVLLLVVSHAVPQFAQAAGGFATRVVFLCLGAFLFSAVMQAAGLDRRIALWLLDRLRASTANGVIWAMFAANVVLSFVVPAANARAAALLPVTNGIVKLFGDTADERRARKAIVIQALVYGSMISGMCILTAHLPNMVIVGLFQKTLGVHISYADWFKLQWPYLGMFAITQLWVQWYFGSRGVAIPGGREAVAAARRAASPAGWRDVAILAVLAAVAVLWATESLHGIASENVALLGTACLFAPGLLGFGWKEVQERTIWGTVLLLGGALSLSSAISATGLAQWAAAHIYALASGHPWWAALAIVMAATHVIRIGMLSNVAAVTMIAPIMLALAPRLGLHPLAFTLLVSDTDSFAYILPTQITAGVIAYSSGAFTTADYAKVGVVSVVIAIVYGIVVIAPWYAHMGIPIWDPSAPLPFSR